MFKKMKKMECWKLESICGAKGEFLSLVGRFATKVEAELAKPHSGGYGWIITKETIIIYDTAIEFDPTIIISY